MAVTETPPHERREETTTTRTAKKGGASEWVKKHKAVTVLGGVGAVVLLISHKGSSSSQSASQTAQDAAAEQAAIDQAVGDATGVQGSSGGNTGLSGGDTGTDTGTGSGDGSGTGEGGGNAGGGDGAGGVDPTGGLTVNVNIPSNSGAPTGGGVSSGGGGSGHFTSKATTITSGQYTGIEGLTAPSGHKKPPPKKGYTTVGLGGGKWAYVPTRAAHGATHPHIVDPFNHPKNTHPKSAPRAGRKPPPAPREPPPKTHPKRKGKGSIVKFGRFFDGAQSCHVGQAHVSSDGVVHEPVTINYGGYTETHMSHNRGDAWTDNVPGYTPPSRGVPIERLGTPPLVELEGEDWR